MYALGNPIAGETVTVYLRTLAGYDGFNDEIWAFDDGTQVVNVLVNPSTTTYNRITGGHLEAVECDLTLYFPREYDADLRGAVIAVRDDRYTVIGDPERYTDANLPPDCLWNMVVKVVRHSG